jgi:excisionase family DNA binding protein
MTIQEVADMYRVSTKTVRRWISSGDLPAERLPGNRMIRIDTANISNLTKPVGHSPKKPRTWGSQYITFKFPKKEAPSRIITITDYSDDDGMNS